MKKAAGSPAAFFVRGGERVLKKLSHGQWKKVVHRKVPLHRGALVLSPIGTAGNSPVLQHWVVPRRRAESRQGRKTLSAVPDGTLPISSVHPAMNGWATTFRPCGTDRRQPSLQTRTVRLTVRPDAEWLTNRRLVFTGLAITSSDRRSIQQGSPLGRCPPCSLISSSGLCRRYRRSSLSDSRQRDTCSSVRCSAQRLSWTA